MPQQRVAILETSWPAVGMGAKYLPTIKDQKATERFMQKQKPLPKFKKPTDPKVSKKVKK